MSIICSQKKSLEGIPKHIAIIMDGNGRWAKKRFLPRVAGHVKGVDVVRKTVESCKNMGVQALTLFAFSSENWRRPQDEVSFLMKLFLKALDAEVQRLHQEGIQLRVIGDTSKFSPDLVQVIQKAQTVTAGNKEFILSIAANYGGRWDVVQAANRLRQMPDTSNNPWTEDDLLPHLALSDLPDPDLFIRTGGELRISNFLLWQLAYAELYFTDTLWPDFDSISLNLAIDSFRKRERRFGHTTEQLNGLTGATN